jgi:phosphoribosylformimino-5-aminoimidazole carboxamide ribotide isomerase
MSSATAFEILPAIDLRGGRVVRLRQGDFARETVYSDDPVEVARGFAAAGARWLHVVDLDGARAGEPVNGAIVHSIVAAVGERMQVEVAGGLRTVETVAAILGLGAARAVVGTAALRDPSFAGDLVTSHGSARIAVAIDVRHGLAVGHGWVEGSETIEAAEAIRRLSDVGLTTFEVTAIERDGLLGGPDLALYERLVAPGAGTVIASGGIATIDDLRAVQDLGCAGGIVGRALLDGSIDLRDAIGLMATRQDPRGGLV